MNSKLYPKKTFTDNEEENSNMLNPAEAYRQIADKIDQIERLAQECREIAAEAQITFTFPTSVLDHNPSDFTASSEYWSASDQSCSFD